MWRIYLFFVFVGTIVGCHKPKGVEVVNYTITGVVFDYDSKLPIAGATIYSTPFPILTVPLDSATTDGSGKVIFTHSSDEGVWILSVKKSGFILPEFFYYIPTIQFVDRIDTLYLGRPSFVDMYIHRTGTYQTTDVIEVTVNHNTWGGAHTQNVYANFANSPDTLIHVPTFYMFPYGMKLQIERKMTRSGGIVTTYFDSTDKIQYGVRNYFLNY